MNFHRTHRGICKHLLHSARFLCSVLRAGQLLQIGANCSCRYLYSILGLIFSRSHSVLRLPGCRWDLLTAHFSGYRHSSQGLDRKVLLRTLFTSISLTCLPVRTILFFISPFPNPIIANCRYLAARYHRKPFPSHSIRQRLSFDSQN